MGPGLVVIRVNAGVSVPITGTNTPECITCSGITVLILLILFVWEATSIRVDGDLDDSNEVVLDVVVDAEVLVVAVAVEVVVEVVAVVLLDSILSKLQLLVDICDSMKRGPGW